MAFNLTYNISAFIDKLTSIVISNRKDILSLKKDTYTKEEVEDKLNELSKLFTEKIDEIYNNYINQFPNDNKTYGIKNKKPELICDFDESVFTIKINTES